MSIHLRETFIGKLTDQSGSAIYIAGGSSLKVIGCSFESCISQVEGGAIYFEGTQMEFSSNCAETCYIINSIDDKFGNLIITYCSIDQEYNLSSAYLCSSNKLGAADSTAALEGFAKMRSSNFSECISNYGTAGPFFRSSCEASDINVYKGNAYFGIYFVLNSSVKNIIINGVEISVYIFYSHAKLTIENSIILATCVSNKVANQQIQFSNCFGNVTYTGITLMDMSLKTHFKRCANIAIECTNARERIIHGFCLLQLMTLIKNYI